jgi:methionine-rich copper-binding protein CopC
MRSSLVAAGKSLLVSCWLLLAGLSFGQTTVSTSSVNFGNVALNEASASRTVSLKNAGAAAITIGSIGVSGSSQYALVSTPAQCVSGNTLAVGASCNLAIAVTPTSLGAVSASTLTIATTASNSPASVSLSATGVAPTALSVASVAFGNVVLNEASAVKTVTLYNYQLTPVTISSVTVPSQYAVSSTTCGTTLAAYSTCYISITATPSALGPVPAGSLSVATNAPNSPITAALSATGIPAISLNATSLALGNTAVGTTSATKLLTITNQSTGSLSLTQAIFNGPFALDTTSAIATECPLSGGTLTGVLPALSKCVFGVTFTPTALGPASGGKVTILDNDPSGPVSATLTGTGEPPVALAPASLAFGNVVENTTSAAKSLTFTNYQPTPVTLSSIAAPAPFAIAPGGNACSVSTPVAANSSCTVYVTYAPTGVGPAPTSSLTVQYNSSTGPQSLSSTLTGSGVPPVATDEGLLFFGNAILGQPITKTFRFTNYQTVPTTITSISGLSGAFSINATKTTCAVSPATVPAGGYCIMGITFTPTTLGAQAGSVTLNNTSSIPAVSVNLTGTGTSPVSLSQTGMTFEAHTEGTSDPAQTSKLTNLQSVPLNISSATIIGADPGDFAVTSTCPTAPSSLPAGMNCSFSVTFTPTASGSRTATLSIVQDATTAPLTISLIGPGVPPVIVSPSSITNFTAPVGTTSRATSIIIKNAQSSAPLHISQLQLTGDFTQSATTCPLAPAALAPLAYCFVYVQFNPTIGGTRDGQLQVVDDTITSPQVTNLSGVGTSPLTIATPLNITPVGLSFSAQLLNTASPAKTIILTNHESQPETFNVAATGDYTANSNCAAGTIAANSSCLIFVSFDPSSVTPSTRTGALTVTHSAAIGSPLLASLTGSAISTPPGAAVAVVSPGAGAAGSVVNVVITGNTWTHFSPSSVISFTDTNNSAYASDIQVTSQTFISVNQINATLKLTGGAGVIYGARNITVKTPLTAGGTETASLLSAFIIGNPSNAHSVSAVSPGLATQGQTLNVALKGSGTSWINGTTYANFGDGVTVNSLTVTDKTDAVANVTISNTTPIGYRTITLITGGEFDVSVLNAQNDPLFQIGSNGAALVAVSPNVEAQGWTGQVTITSTGTHFVQNATQVSIGGAIVGDVNVSGTTAVAEVAVPAGAPLGPQTVTVTTGGETESLGNAFTITGATPALLSVTPSSGQQGQSLSVVLRGNAYTNFVAGQVSVEFDGNIQSGTPTVTAHQVIVPITIARDANAGSITANLLSGPAGSVTIFPFTFTVTANSAAIVSVSPSSVPQGGQLTLSVVGQNTNWSQADTVAGFYPEIVPTPSFDLIAVADATHATLNIAVPTNTPPGTYPFYIATGGQVVSSSVTVFANTPTVTMSPANGMVPTAAAPTVFTANITGHFTHFTTNTVSVVSGEGVSLTFTPTSNVSGTATVTILPGAPLGTRTVTFISGGEIVTTSFSVTSTPVGILSVSPYYGLQSATEDVEIVGLNTHFVQGTIGGTGTQVLFGPQITVNSVTVKSPTDLVANVTMSYTNEGVPTPTPFGWQSIYVNTGSEMLVAGFDVYYAASNPFATPEILSVVPSSAQQGATVDVTITGTLTNWVNGTTEAILGAGVTVSNLTVTSTTTATATIAVSPTAPVGGNSVTMITGSEIESGAGFNVTPGGASIVSVEPNFTCPQQTVTAASFGCSGGSAPTGVPVVAQLQTVTLNIVGVGTHWLQGETTLNFGGGVNVDQLTISSPTTAQAQITVLSGAPVGFATVTASTDGENASLAQGIDIEEGSPTLLAISPAYGQQAGSYTIQVLGRFTHFSQATTNVAFNQDIKVNSVTVIDSETLTANVSISPLAYVDIPDPYCGHVLTATTGNEQVSTSYGSNFCVSQGAEEITSVTPLEAVQGSTLVVTITGAATNFVAGETQVSFGDGNFQVGQITVSSPTSLTVPVGVSTAATTGFKTVTVSTRGQVASQQYSFTVDPGVATLNEAIPNQAEQGAPLSGQSPLMVRLIGQYSHFTAQSMATFGPGITVISTPQYVSSSEIDVFISIDPLAYPGGRTVTVTTPNVPCSAQPPVASTGVSYPGCTAGSSSGTGSEIVTASVFSVITGPAIITGISPATGNEGQEVVVNVTGSGTHWAQNFTQFYISGAGYDITVNSVVVNSPTSATVDMTISNTASRGARSISMVTNGEALLDAGAFVVTGGIPVITTVSPNSAPRGTTGLEVTIVGNDLTRWDSTSVPAFGPGVTVASFQVDDNAHIEALLNIDPAAQLGYRTVTVQTGSQLLTSNFQVTLPASEGGNPPPPPYIWYESPSSGIPGQTLTITFLGSNTNWDPNPTTGTQLTGFQPGITLNSFQVTSPTSALANITISPSASASVSDLTLTTNTATPQEVDSAGFSVVVAQPVLSIVDPGSAIQGAQNLTVNIIGQFTAFDSTTTFNFGSGITVNGPPTILGPTIAMQSISVGQETPTGGRGVVATTPDAPSLSQVVGGASINVTPSLALIASIAPNTALQGTTATVEVTGQNTHWGPATSFQFGAGIVVTTTRVNSATDATLTLYVPPLASEGPTGATATTAGEIASISNGFVVQAGTPLLLSSDPSSLPQQSSAVFTILSQSTNWSAANPPVVSYGAGVTLTNVIVTSPTSLTVDGSVQATTPTGSRNLTVTTSSQSLSLPGVFYVAPGPAAINSVTPNTAGQGATLNVTIAGINTNWQQGVTQLSFPGVSINSLTVNSPRSITANITVSDYTSAGQYSISTTTGGEIASGSNLFTVTQTQPELLAVVKSAAMQGESATVTLTGAFTHFSSSSVPSFGAGITVDSVNALSLESLQVNITVSPTAYTGSRTVSVTTGTESVSLNNAFNVTTGPAAIASLSPATGYEGGSVTVLVTGSQTNFTTGVTSASFGGGIVVTGLTVVDLEHAKVTVSIPGSTPVGSYNVTLTTAGESATILGGFAVTLGNPVLTAVAPPTGHQGDTNLSVSLTGQFTNFVNGTSTASFGAGITVNSLTVSSATSAAASITISPTATLASRTVTVTTGTEVASINGGFTVLAGLPSLVSATPGSAQAGATTNVVVTGAFTSFQQNATTVSFGSGVTVNSVTVASATQLSANITVDPNAYTGTRDITVTTGTQTETLSGGFTVLPGTPVITQINPNIGTPNSTVTVTIQGQYTNWGASTTVSFGPGISVGGAAEGASGPVTVNSATSITATLNIDTEADLGPRDVTVTTGTEIDTVPAGFTVQQTTVSPPTVVSISPDPGTAAPPINTSIYLVFSQPMARATITTSNVLLYLSGGNGRSGSNVPVSGNINLDASGRVVTFTPTAALAVNTQYYIELTNGVTDASGNSIGYYASYFTTAFSASTTAPKVVAANPPANTATVGTNVSIQLEFSVPMNEATQAGLTLSDGTNDVAGSFSWNGQNYYGCGYSYPLETYVCNDGSILTFTPASPLTPNHTYTVNYGAPLADTAGNALTPGSFSFTTGSGADTAYNSASLNFDYYQTNLGTNFVPTVTFAKPVNPIDINSSTMYLYNIDSGKYLRGTVAVAPDGLSATFTPAMPLLPDTAYYFVQSYGYFDMDGNFLDGTSSAFITGTGPQLTPPQVSSIEPANMAATVPLNAQVVVHYSEPIDPDNPGTLTLTSAGGTTVPGTTTLLGDQVTLTFVPSASLAPNTVYTVSLTGFKDFSGNAGAAFTSTFTTLNSVTPLNLSTGYTANGTLNTTGDVPDANWVVTVGSNAPVAAEVIGSNDSDFYPYQAANGPLSSWIAPNSSGNSGFNSYTYSTTFNLTGYSRTNLCLVGSEGVFPSGLLQLNGNPISQQLGFDSYTLDPVNIPLPASSLDVGVNTLSFAENSNEDYYQEFRFQGSIQTCGATLTGGLSLVSSTPAAGATNVATNSTITLNFNNPIDPATVNSNTIRVLNSGNSYDQIAGTYQVNGSQVVFTPAGPLPVNTNFYVYAYGGPTDVAGDTFSGSNYLFNFTTGGTATPASTPFQVTAFSPAAGTANVGLRAPVVATFNRSFNPYTINQSNAASDFALFSGDSLNCTNYMKSQDNTTLQFNCYPLPASSTMTAYVNSNLQDMSGNPVANFSSQFTTSQADSSTRGSIIASRPGSGAGGISVNEPLVLFASLPIDPSTASLQVAQNGVAITGTIQILDNGYTLQFTPSAPFAPGALIQWYTNLIDATYGSTFNNTSGYFNVAADTSTLAPTIQTASPVLYSYYTPALNSIVDLQFNTPLDPSTINSSNIYLYDSRTGLNVPVTYSTPQPNVVRMVPQADLSPNAYIYIYVTAGLHSSTSVPATATVPYFYTGSADDNTVPTVTNAVPYNGAVNIGVNVTPGVVFSKAIDPVSINSTSFQVTNSGTPLAGGFFISSDDTRVEFVPNAPLPASATLTMTLTGVLDQEGHAVSYTSHFQTGPGPDFNRPTVVNTNVGYNGTVPTNSNFTIQFSESMDITTFSTNNIYVYDNVLNQNIAATLSWSSDQSVAYLVPTSPLAAGRSYYLQVYGGTDIAGNPLSGSGYTPFTATFTSTTTAPTVQYVNPISGATGLGINAVIEAQFTAAIDPTTIGGVTLTTGGATVPATPYASAGNTVVQLVPATPLLPNTLYQINISGVKDPAGNTVGVFTSSFTTGATYDLASPTLVANDPPNNATVGTNVVPRLAFNKPLNPLTVSNATFSMYLSDTGQFIPLTVTPSANGLTVTLQPQIALLPNTTYYYRGYNYQDADGNGGSYFYLYFTTSNGADTARPMVNVSPVAGSTGIPLNAQVTATIFKPIDPTSWTQTSIQLFDSMGNSVSGAVSQSATNVLTFVPASNLAPNVTYTVNVSGFTDADGNLATPSNTTFTTGAAAAATGGLTLVSSNIPIGSAFVSSTQPIVLTFSQILDPTTVNAGTLKVYDSNYYNTGIAGTYTVSGAQVTFTPTSPYPAGAQISVAACNGPTDVLGDVYPGYCGPQLIYFTVSSATTDTTPLTVVSVNPAAGATGVRLDVPVSVTFNKSINPSSVYGSNANNALLYAGQSLRDNGSVSFSADNRTIYFNVGALSGGTVYAIELPAGGVSDLSGNALASLFTSTFTTANDPATGNGSVTGVEPGYNASGVPTDTLITAFVNRPVDPSTLSSTTSSAVTVNGQVYPGTAQVIGGGYEVQYTPTVPFPAGAVIQWFLAGVSDTSGNPINSASGTFYTAPTLDPTARPQLVNTSPAYGSNNVPVNAQFDFQYSQPIDASTLAGITVGNYYGNNLPAYTISLPTANVVRVTLAAALTPSTYYYLYLGGSFNGTNGVAAQNGYAYFVTTTAGADTTPGTVKIGPPNGSVAVGTNAYIRLQFSKPVDPTTVNASTIAVTSGGTVIPGSFSLNNTNSDYTGASFSPLNPLPASSPIQVSVNGVLDYAGNTFTQNTTQFTTAPGPDFTQATVAMDFSYGATGIATNASFTCLYSKPIDPSSITPSGLFVYDETAYTMVPVTYAFSADMMSVTMTPTSALNANSPYEYVCYYAIDLTGNGTQYGYRYFTTGSGPSTTGPTLLYANPPNGATSVALNTNNGPFDGTSLGLLFSEPIAENSLGGITLTPAGGSPLAIGVSQNIGDTEVAVTLPYQLQPNTVYTFNISGVTDYTGNAVTPVTSSFTTGASLDYSSPTITGSVPANGDTNVAVTTPLTITFSKPMNPILFDSAHIYLRDHNTLAVIPTTFTLSADLTTISLTPVSPLTAGTIYDLIETSSYWNLTDIAGNGLSTNYYYYSPVATFTTAP